MIVLDASAFLSFLLKEESSVLSQNVIEQILVDQIEIVVPPIFKLEVLNAVLMAFKRQRITIEVAEECVGFIDEFPAQVDYSIPIEVIAKTALDYSLTSYDAAYIALAQNYGIPLVSLDKAMQRISAKLSLPVLE